MFDLFRLLRSKLAAVFAAAMLAACSPSIGSGGGDGVDAGDGQNGNGNGSGGCFNLECLQAECEGGGTTTVSGFVHIPSGEIPLPNVDVWVPNADIAPIGARGDL